MAFSRRPYRKVEIMENFEGPPTAEVAELQLYRAARDMSLRLDSFLASRDEEVAGLISRAARHAVGILSDAEVTENTRDTALRALVVVQPVTDPAFWRTALGRMIAWHVGYGHHEVPRAHAAAILGFTRQRIAQMVNSGDLVVTGSGVTNQSLLTRLWKTGTRG